MECRLTNCTHETTWNIQCSMGSNTVPLGTTDKSPSQAVHRKPVSRFPSNWMCQKGLSQETGSRSLFPIKALWWTSFDEHTHLHNPHSCCDRECVHHSPRNLPWVPAQSWLLSPWRQILLSSTPELCMNGLMQGYTFSHAI